MKKAFLFMLGLFATIGMQAQTSPWAGNEVKEGVFYLYNVESGLWLQNNDSKAGDWSTRAAIGTRGLDFTLAGSEGAFTLGAGFGSASINPDNNYLDTGNNPAWTFTSVTVDGVTNAYNINCGNKVLGVVRYNEAGKQDNLFTQTGDERWYLENPDFNIDMTANNTWQLVTKEERLAKMQADASVDNPQDASWLIPSADFANNDRRWDNMWTRNLVSGNGRAADGNGIQGSKCVESWNSGNSIDFYVSINVPNGTYKLSVQGYYRDGNVDDVVIRRDAGTETIRGYYYANEVSHPLMSILDEAKDAKVDGAWDTERSGRWYPDSQNSANKCFNLHKGYVNPEIEVVVTTGILKIGVGKNGGVANDWIVVDNFKLTYLGNNIDLTTYLEALQTAIDNGNAFDTSSTSSVLAQALAAAISDGQSALSSTDPDEISAATAAITNAISAAKAVDLKVLNATIALAKQEGIDTSAAETIASQATSAAEVNDALFDLRAARKIKAQSMPDVYTGSEPAEGKVYIYNIGTGLFLGTGSSYNTHCAVDQVGIEVELIASGNGFKIKTNRGGGWLAKGNAEASAYVDSWNGDQVWTFIPVSAGIYNISFDGSDTNLLGYNPRSQNDNNTGIFWGSIGIKREDGADPMNQWKIVTAEERESLIANASKQNPVDVSYLITAASMNAQDNRDAWTKEVSGGNGGPWVDNFENHGFECWNADNFKLSQTIEGLKPGLYEVKVQAFWREGNGANQVAIVNNGGELQQKAYLFANDQQQPLPNIASALDIVPGIGGDATSNKGIFPNWVNEALEYIETGAYWATVKAVVGEDGKLLIGIGVDEKVADGDWVVADNFRLAYLGNDETDVAYERAVAAIKDGQTYRVFTEVNGNKFYLNTAGYLVNDTQKAATFTFTKITSGNTLYETGWNLGCKFTNPSLTNGSSGDVVQNGHIIVGGNDRNDWERQVFFLNAEGKYAVRATNANSANWGANTFWTVTDTEAELPKADYALTSNYVWQIEENVDNRPEAFDIASSWVTDIQAAAGLVTDEGQWSSNAKEPKEGSFAALTDGDYTTFFHSLWSATGPAEDHYLQAELPDAAQEFYFYFKRRSQNNNNRPTTIVISGSNDGQNFTEITTITEGLPTDGSVIDYLSAKVAANEAYKYIRFTVPSTNSGNANNGHVFFTFSEFYILPSDELIDKARAYMNLNDYTDLTEDDVPIIKQLDAELKAAFSTVKVTYALYDGNGAEPIKTKTVVVEANSEVQVPSDFTSIAYYDYTVEGEIADVDCTIKVFRSMKNGVVHQLSDLSNDKAYTIRCDRGALLTKDDYLASTAHNSLTSAEPADFALISYEDNIYLYSVADKKFVQNNGALAEMPSNGVFDAVQMEAKTDPYFFTYFKISDSKNYGLNTNGNDPYGYVINDWMNADAGNQYYMIESSEFDATEALAALEAYFHPSYFVTYVVKDAEGTELFKSEPQPAREGDKITTLPADFQRAFTTYDEVDVTVAEAETTVEFTATSTFPFEISASFDEAKWYNMTIRSDYYVAMDETEPYYPKADKDLDAPESQWAFAGDAYNGIVVMNKAAGEGWSLTKDGDNVVMREGAYAWTIGANADGFTLREIGTDNNCVNQNGGASGPLQFWNNAGSLADNGSTFRVTEVVVPEPVILNAPTWSVADGTQAEPNMLSAATPLLITYTADNVEENGYNPDDLKVKVTVVVSGDLPENMMTMGSQTAHRVLGESFYIPLGEAEFPVALKLGYVYQNIVVTAAQLVANAETDAEEVIASYAGAPAQLHWIGKEEISMAQEMTITSTVGSFYEGLSADAPMADILLALGAESLEGVEIFALLPDDTRDPNYQLGTTDGWRDADGNWKAWADGPDFFIKANFELPSGQIYEAGGYPGKTNEEKTFTAKYVFVKGEAEVTLTVNLVYEPAPTVDIDFSDLAVQGEPIVIEKTSPVGSSYEGFKADVDIASILTTLGVQSLDDVDIFAVQSDESLDPNYGVGTTDGWRNADGDWQSWGADARLCVKADFTTASEQIYYIGGMDGQTSASGSYSAIFAFVKKNSETHEAVVLQVKLTYTASDAQMALEEEIANAEGLIEESQNAELYDQDNAALAAAVATLNDAIDAAKAKLGTTDDEMIAATNALKEAEDAFKSALTAIYGINADQLNGTIYDLGGRKIQKVQRGGVYIVNGKKVAVK